MSFSTKLITGALLTGIVAVSAASVLPAQAQSTDTTDLNLTILAGALTITSTATQSLSNITLSNALQTSSGTVSAVEVADLTGSLAGWSSNVKFSNLTGATVNTKRIVLASDVTANFGTAAKYLRVTPSGHTTVSGNSGSLTTPSSQGTITALSALDNLGESNTFAMMSAASGAGNGTYQFNTGIEIDIPAYGQYPASVTSGPISAQNYVGVATFQVS